MLTQKCLCPPGARHRCSPRDKTHDVHGHELCCPDDSRAMAAFYREPYYASWEATSGKRAAMRKRRMGTLEEIAQRAAENR